MHTNLINAAGFDCAKATSAIENLICSNDTLSQLDDKNTALYRDYKSICKDENLAIHDQRDWLVHTRNACLDASCLEDVYQKRNAYLNSRVENNNLHNSSVEIARVVDRTSEKIAEVHSDEMPTENEMSEELTKPAVSAEIESASQETSIKAQGTQQTEVTTELDNKRNQNIEAVKLTNFAAVHANAISGLIILILLTFGLLFPALVRKVF